jgi:hypothetical protein
MHPRDNITNATLQTVLMKNKYEMPFGIIEEYNKHIYRLYKEEKIERSKQTNCFTWVPSLDMSQLNVIILTRSIAEQYIVMYISSASQRLGKHCLKPGITAEAEVNLLGNGWLNTFTVNKNRCPLLNNGLVTLELTMFPAQRIRKQQKRNP